MRSIQIKDSFDVWHIKYQKLYANRQSYIKYAEKDAAFALRRTWFSIHVEWWLHNIGYYITKPFIKNKLIEKYNLRFKDIDLTGVDPYE